MAVEARHMYRFPSQLLTNRGFIKLNQGNADMYSAQMYSGLPLAGTMPEGFPPFTQSVDYNLGSAKTFINKADSGLSYSIPDHRKRPTDSINELSDLTVPQKRTKLSGLPSFVDRDIIFQAQQQQQGDQIDCFFAQYAEKLSSKLEEQKRMLVSAFQENFTKKLKEKEDEIQRMGKLNWVLQERVESLWVENQIWRDLAQTNEAMANSLRNDLEQVLAHVTKDSDAESSCGSNDMGGQCEAADEGGDEAETMKDKAVVGSVGDRMCRQCRVRESRVLLLLCRHLCLCTTCGSNLRSCPVCHSVINASVHVDFS